MARKPPKKQTRLQSKAGKSDKVLTGPKGSKPQSTTNKRLARQGNKTKTSGPKLGSVMSKATKAASAKATPTKSASGSSMKADAQAWQRLNQSASARAGKAAEPKPRTPAPGTGDPIKSAMERATRTKAVAAMKSMSGKLARARMMRGPASALAGIAAEKTLGPAATKAGEALGRGPLRALGRKIDDALPVVNSRDEARRRRAQAAAKGSSSRFKGARDAAMKKASAIKGSPVVGPKKSAAKSFDSAFAAARKSGKSTFTWRGKKYNTKIKGEK
jgi:hypothetical protein